MPALYRVDTEKAETECISAFIRTILFLQRRFPFLHGPFRALHGIGTDPLCFLYSLGFPPRNNRSQLVDTGRNKLIVDAYNANPTSMMAALENFRQVQAPHKMVILGDMKELGEASLEEHRKIVGFLDGCRFDRVMLAGPEFKAVASAYEHFDNVDAVKEALEKSKPVGFTILIKGSNSMKLSQLPAYL